MRNAKRTTPHQIRDASHADIAEVAAQFVRDCRAGDYPGSIGSATATSYFSHLIAHQTEPRIGTAARCYAIDDDQGLAGFAVVRLSSIQFRFLERDLQELWHFSIFPRSRGQQVGSALLGGVLDVSDLPLIAECPSASTRALGMFDRREFERLPHRRPGLALLFRGTPLDVANMQDCFRVKRPA
jgi:GNAT superfamily N-acetyltransferase